MDTWHLHIGEYSDTATEGALPDSGSYEVLALRQPLRRYNCPVVMIDSRHRIKRNLEHRLT